MRGHPELQLLKPVAPRRAKIGPIGLVLVALLATALAPSAVEAASTEGLRGELTFNTMRASGQTVASLGETGILHMVATAKVELGAWTLAADAIHVNWSQTSTTGVAYVMPGRPDEPLYGRANDDRYGDKDFANATITFAGSNPPSAMLAEGYSDLDIQVHVSTSLAARASVGEQWKASKDAADTAVDPPTEQSRLEASRKIPAGQPTFMASAAELIVLSGDFTLWFWGIDATVAAPGAEPETYRSGSWEESAGGTGAVTRNGYQQLLRVTVIDGQLSIPGWGGAVRLAGQDPIVNADGKFVFEQATGELSSGDEVFVAASESFAVAGNLKAQIRSTKQSDTLSASLQSDSVDTNLKPANKDPESGPTQGPGQHAAGNPAAAKMATLPTTSASEFGWVLALGAFLLVSGLFALVWVLRRRLEALPSDPRPLLDDAERALVAGNGPEARRLAAKVLAADPDQVDAWFVHGASLIHENRFDEAISDVEPIAKRLKGNETGLAFLLCLAYLRKQAVAKARPWALVAARELEFRQQMDLDETFAPLRTTLPSPAVAVSSRLSPDAAYA